MTVITRADFSRFNILVIDDSPFILRLVSEMLKSFGVGTVCLASAADEAFAKMQRNPPDVIFCDWEMYPADGLSVLRKLRQQSHSRFCHIPFIMLTGHNGNDDVTTALGEGADSYVVKPFSCETLMNHLLKVIVADKGHLADPRQEWAID
jgi:two-component system chemotaxis response regulator CheY